MKIVITQYKFNVYTLHFLSFLVLLRSTNMGFAYPSAEFALGGIGYGPQKLMQILALIGLSLFLVLNLKRTLHYLLPNPVISLLFVSILISIVFSPDIWATFRFFISVLIVSLPIYLHYKFLGFNSLYKLLNGFFVFTVAVCFIYVLILPQYGIMTAKHDGAWRGLFVHKNSFGGFLALISIFLFVESFAIKSSLATKMIFILAVLMVVLSKSATAIVALIFCFSTFFFLLYLTQFKQKSNRLLLLVLYFLAALIIYLIVSSNIDSILMMLGKDPTLSGRSELWAVLLELSIERPTFGYGLGYFHRPEVMYQFTSAFGWAAKSTHSSYVDLILGIGYVGTCLFAFIVGKLLFSAIMSRANNLYERKVIAAALSCVFGVLVVAASSSGVMLGNSVTWVLFVALLCLVSTHMKQKNMQGVAFHHSNIRRTMY
jgi:exopolysaccharide production protein ExoQ